MKRLQWAPGRLLLLLPSGGPAATNTTIQTSTTDALRCQRRRRAKTVQREPGMLLHLFQGGPLPRVHLQQADKQVNCLCRHAVRQLPRVQDVPQPPLGHKRKHAAVRGVRPLIQLTPR